MKKSKFVLAIATLSLFSTLFANSSLAASNYDLLAQQKISYKSNHPDEVLTKTLKNTKSIFEKYIPALDSSFKIISPLSVGGTSENPVVKLSLRKCISFLCKTVDLDAEFSVIQTSGKCEKNAILVANLSRSSSLLTNVYEKLEVSICYKKDSANSATLELVAAAKKSVQYSSGIIQKQIFDLLKLQINPIVKAVSQTLSANE